MGPTRTRRSPFAVFLEKPRCHIVEQVCCAASESAWPGSFELVIPVQFPQPNDLVFTTRDGEVPVITDCHRVDPASMTGESQHRLGCAISHTRGLWGPDETTGLRALTGHTLPVNSVAVSADCRIAVSGRSDAVRVWDLASGACVRTLSDSSWATPVAVSADACIAAFTASDRTVRVWALDWDYEFTAPDPRP